MTYLSKVLLASTLMKAGVIAMTGEPAIPSAPQPIAALSHLKRGRRRNYFMVIHMIRILALTVMLAGASYFRAGDVMAQEARKYSVVETVSDTVEIRAYAPSLIAKVSVTGDRDDAAGDAFSILAGFIFGDNARSEKISMTAPVTQAAAQFTSEDQSQSWTVDFTMPSAYTLETLPVPKDDAITIEMTPASKMVVIRFAGTGSARNLKKHRESLGRQLALRSDIKIDPQPVYAFYNAPFVPGFMRRNEIMYRVLP